MCASMYIYMYGLIIIYPPKTKKLIYFFINLFLNLACIQLATLDTVMFQFP